MLKEEQRKLVDVILVDILSNTKQSTVLYSGLLVKFDLIPNTRELAYITIRSANRRDLQQGTSKMLNPQTGQESKSYFNENGPFWEIPGKYLTLLGKEILNINVTYYKIESDSNGSKKFTVVVWQHILVFISNISFKKFAGEVNAVYLRTPIKKRVSSLRY